MVLLTDWVTDHGRRSSMDSTLGFTKRAAKHDSGLCLVCGRRATGRCSKCAIATFCGPQCQEAAHSTHSGTIIGSCASCTVVEKMLNIREGRRLSTIPCNKRDITTSYVGNCIASVVGRVLALCPGCVLPTEPVAAKYRRHWKIFNRKATPGLVWIRRYMSRYFLRSV